MNSWVTAIDAATLSRYHSVYLRAWMLSLAIVLIELTGSFVSGSFALRADVWHVLGDMVVAIAPVAVTYARAKGFNPHRLILFGGATVATALMAIGAMLLLEARQQLLSPVPLHEVRGWLLSAFSLLSAGMNLWQHRMLSRIQVSDRDLTHLGFHFHVRMDMLKNLALPSLGALLALRLVPQRADSWAAAGVGALIAIRGLLLLAGMLAFRKREAHLSP
jgi:Co/Zn/Cd efflux system component